MAEDGHVSIVGNLTRDPELRFTSGGKAVANFSVAVNRVWGYGDNRQEAVSFFDVTCWEQLAENVAESLTKGTRVFVKGRLDQRSWETDDGQKRSKVEIVADVVGPDLRWATCTVVRNDKADHSDRKAAGKPAGYDQYAPDEEPF